MDGRRHAVTSADGTEIGLLTAGDGPPLLLVHGGMGIVDLEALATGVEAPVLLILGGAGPAWARDLTEEVVAALEHKTLAVLDGQGHDAIDAVPELLVTRLAAFFG